MSGADFIQGYRADFQKNHFQLFGLPEHYRIDDARIERAFRTLQAQVHPDKFAHLPESGRRVSMQWSTHVNEAYQILRNPVARARYLLALHGVDTQEEINTAMPLDFLMEQMDLREAVAKARSDTDPAQLSQMERQLNLEMGELKEKLAVALDDTQDYTLASENVRKLKFMEKQIGRAHV